MIDKVSPLVGLSLLAEIANALGGAPDAEEYSVGYVPMGRRRTLDDAERFAKVLSDSPAGKEGVIILNWRHGTFTVVKKEPTVKEADRAYVEAANDFRANPTMGAYLHLGSAAVQYQDAVNASRAKAEEGRHECETEEGAPARRPWTPTNYEK